MILIKVLLKAYKGPYKLECLDINLSELSGIF